MKICGVDLANMLIPILCIFFRPFFYHIIIFMVCFYGVDEGGRGRWVGGGGGWGGCIISNCSVLLFEWFVCVSLLVRGETRCSILDMISLHEIQNQSQLMCVC